jgi:hypothetical protein
MQSGCCLLALTMLIGCGAPQAAVPAISVQAADGAQAASEPTAASEESTEPQTDASAVTVVAEKPNSEPDEPYAEIKQFAFAALQFKRIGTLKDRETHAELKLTHAQIQLFTTEGARVEEQFTALQRTPHEQLLTKVKAEFVPQARRYQTLIDRELTPAQQQQLFQRVIRAQRGAIVLLFPGVPEALEYKDEQWKAICGIVDNNLKTVRLENATNPLEVLRLSQRAQASRTAAENSLTPQQRQKWNAMLGK